MEESDKSRKRKIEVLQPQERPRDYDPFIAYNNKRYIGEGAEHAAIWLDDSESILSNDGYQCWPRRSASNPERKSTNRLDFRLCIENMSSRHPEGLFQGFVTFWAQNEFLHRALINPLIQMKIEEFMNNNKDILEEEIPIHQMLWPDEPVPIGGFYRNGELVGELPIETFVLEIRHRYGRKYCHESQLLVASFFPLMWMQPEWIRNLAS